MRVGGGLGGWRAGGPEDKSRTRSNTSNSILLKMARQDNWGGPAAVDAAFGCDPLGRNSSSGDGAGHGRVIRMWRYLHGWGFCFWRVGFDEDNRGCVFRMGWSRGLGEPIIIMLHAYLRFPVGDTPYFACPPEPVATVTQASAAELPVLQGLPRMETQIELEAQAVQDLDSEITETLPETDSPIGGEDSADEPAAKRQRVVRDSRETLDAHSRRPFPSGTFS